MKNGQDISGLGERQFDPPGEDVARFAEIAGDGQSHWLGGVDTRGVDHFMASLRIDGWPRERVESTGINAGEEMAKTGFDVFHLDQ